MATIAYNGIIYGNDTVELTKAEYDALGDVVLTDGKTYFITDIDAGGGGGNTSSTEISLDEFKRLEAEGLLDPEIVYYVIDGEDRYNASTIIYNDNETQLGVNSVQDAIEYIVINGSKNNSIIAADVECETANGILSNVQDIVVELDNNINNLNERVDEVFQLGADTKTQLISSLENSGFGLTQENTWEEIISFFKERFPANYYFYKNGDVCSDFTGGYSVSGSYTDYSVNSSGKLFLSSYYKSTSAHAFLHTVKKVPIKKGHTKLIAHVTSASQLWSFAWFYIGTSPTSKTKYTTIIQYDSNGSSSISNKNITIDVSSLEGEYYVGVSIQANTGSGEGATVYIDKIWVE